MSAANLKNEFIKLATQYEKEPFDIAVEFSKLLPIDLVNSYTEDPNKPSRLERPTEGYCINLGHGLSKEERYLGVTVCSIDKNPSPWASGLRGLNPVLLGKAKVTVKETDGKKELHVEKYVEPDETFALPVAIHKDENLGVSFTFKSETINGKNVYELFPGKEKARKEIEAYSFNVNGTLVGFKFVPIDVKDIIVIDKRMFVDINTAINETLNNHVDL